MGAPFRWDLVTPDQLGSLLDGTKAPTLDFAPELSQCAGRVLARSANSDLAFVGRSLDSMYDLLSGALSGIPQAPALERVPLSFARDYDPALRDRRTLTPAELSAALAVLTDVGITPNLLTRRKRPVSFVDVVHEGSTFTDLYDVIRTWVADERAQWDVVRTKIRFIGVTIRRKTSPNTWRWAQHSPWTRELPGSAVTSVSLDGLVWSYLGDYQQKLTRSHAVKHWLADAAGPRRDECTRQALAEAVALVELGRSRDGRRQIAAAIDGEPALAEPWLRSLHTALLR